MTDDGWDRILEASKVADAARRELRADLRANVESLPPGVRWDLYQVGNPDVVLRAAVLALFDGGPE